jgi:hypothetical protein
MINDETLELLSAYLDGALPEGERLALEARLKASADLRAELARLVAVSKAVKDLPKEPLPQGFLVRFQARRARGDSPRQDWVFLPPIARPVALALSCGVIALVIWDKVVVPPTPAPLRGVNPAGVETAANAPISQFNVSKRAAGDGGIESLPQSDVSRSLSVAGAVAAPVERGESLPSLAENDAKSEAAAPAAAPSRVAAVRGSSSRARAAGQPLTAAGPGAATAPEPALTDRTRIAMTEEERSSRNEQMFGFIESEKKKMGIAQVLPRDASRHDPLQAMSAAIGGQAVPPAAPAIAAPAPSLLKTASHEGSAAADSATAAKPGGPGRLSPDAALVFADARSLSSAWVLLGFPGNPPMMDFTSGRLVLIKPSATKIVSVTPDAGAVVIVYRSLLPDEASNSAKDRVAPIPAEPKTVLIYDVTPR